MLNVPFVPGPGRVVLVSDSVRVQVPEAGNPLNATLPVAVEQVGWVMIPGIGTFGAETVAVTSNRAMLSQLLTVWLA